MKVLGLDHGTRRIGMAVSDPMGWVARGLGIVETDQGPENTLDELARVVREEEVERIVVGLPRNMDGTLGPRAEDVLAFVKTLERRLGIPVDTIDERLTSKEADRLLGERRGRSLPRRDRRRERDVIAAQIILTDYLESRRPPDSAETSDDNQLG